MVIRSDGMFPIGSAGQLAQLFFQNVEIDRLAQRLRRTQLAGSAETSAVGGQPIPSVLAVGIRISWVRGNLIRVPKRKSSANGRRSDSTGTPREADQMTRFLRVLAAAAALYVDYHRGSGPGGP